MPTSDPGLRRVTVHAGAQAVDLTLPAAVPVATLIPSIVDILGDRGASPATAARYQLSALGAASSAKRNDIGAMRYPRRRRPGLA